MRLHNRDCLSTTAMLEQISLCALQSVSQNGTVTSVRVLSPHEYTQATLERSWLTIGSGHSWSVALSSTVFIPARAALARSQIGLSVAQAVAEGVLEEGFQAADTILATSSSPPAEWHCIEVLTPFGSILCAGVFLPSLLSHKVTAHPTSASWRVRVRLGGYGDQAREPVAGAVLPLGDFSLSVPEIGIGIRLFVEEKLMGQVDGATERERKSGAIPVRLDLGSLELSLEEIAALREGHRLELDAQLPTACFLRIGQGVVAEASLEQSEQGLVVRVIKTSEMSATSSFSLSI
jgi:hypothetical protein